ncbi:hypothetical protein [Rhizobium leguminosarum]|uniref:hypothetical protein n=1 Tax=Rhizobium leguminosarum TaxID=384 RepID=UPI0016497BB5|nr:hypothetical protein [Rhizobium leguminosarum]
MQRTETSVVHSSGEKLVRACPNNSLREPVRKFEDTFSAEEVVLEKFFKKN